MNIFRFHKPTLVSWSGKLSGSAEVLLLVTNSYQESVEEFRAELAQLGDQVEVHDFGSPESLSIATDSYEHVDGHVLVFAIVRSQEAADALHSSAKRLFDEHHRHHRIGDGFLMNRRGVLRQELPGHLEAGGARHKMHRVHGTNHSSLSPRLQARAAELRELWESGADDVATHARVAEWRAADDESAQLVAPAQKEHSA